jgi:dTDP-4-amino-4,6-dideoxygalactose transaminase
MAKLAIAGGKPVRSQPFPNPNRGEGWPIHGECELRAVREVVESRRWSSAPYLYGDNLEASRVRRFELKWAEYNGVRHAIAVGHGTDALMLAFRAAGVRTGDEVILPPGWLTVNAFLALGAVPVFVDIDPETLQIDATQVEAAITGRTRAICPIYGTIPPDLDALMEIADQHGIQVVADSVWAQGTEWRGRKAAAVSHFGTFSGQELKPLPSGEGGSIITDDDEAGELLYMLHNDGRGLGDEGGLYKVQGWNARMSEFQAAILLCQLERLDEQIEHRTRNAQHLAKGFEEIGGLSFPRLGECITRQNYSSLRLRYDAREFGDVPAALLGRALNAEGIPLRGRGRGRIPWASPLFTEGRVHWDHLKEVAHREVHLPNWEAQAGKWLGAHFALLMGSRKDMDDVLEAVRKVKENIGELVGLQ